MLFNAIPDQQLVSMYLKGEERAFEELLNRHKDRIYTQVMIMVRDEDVADDIFQETFMKVIRTLKEGKYNEEGKFLPWLMRISHNLAIDYFRKNKKMPVVRSDEDNDVFATLTHDGLNVEQAWIREVIHDDIHKLIDQLPEEQREVVMLRHFAGLSFKEISDQCNVSINTSLGRMRYALINMRKLMEKHNISLTR
jgi:RNA polymerase sigma-70 factor (ECF subfamily)